MVNPDVDKVPTHTNQSVNTSRNIPASCHKHTVEATRSVCIPYNRISLFKFRIFNRLAKSYYGQKKLVVLFLVHSIGVTH